jgi:hypothetical protein
MHHRRPRFAHLTAACAAAIAAALSLGGPALAQDAQSATDAYSKKVDADVALYLQKHPVRRSPLFDAVSSLLATLGETNAMAIDQCKFMPDFPDWRDALPGLRENTIIALHASFTKGMRTYMAATPPDEAVARQALCLEDERRAAAMMDDLAAMDAPLRKQGY